MSKGFLLQLFDLKVYRNKSENIELIIWTREMLLHWFLAFFL